MTLKLEKGLEAIRVIAEFVALGVLFEAHEEGRWIVIQFLGAS